MDNRLLVNRPLQPLRSNEQNKIKKAAEKNRDEKKPSFKQIITDKLKDKSDVKFSKHAQKRLMSRDIQVREKDLQLLNNGVERAEEKGSKDSLILVNKVAYVVSVENRTVITAIDDKNLKENIFTNIDSAVFM